MFILIVAAILIVQRQRLQPIYTGIRNLFMKDQGGYQSNIHYQRVDTKVGGNLGSSSSSKYTVHDLEDEDDEDDIG